MFQELGKKTGETPDLCHFHPNLSRNMDGVEVESC
jgi:hypothetical protein